MKRIVFLTGTRADYGKLKSLIKILEDNANYEVYVFITGMHTLQSFGYTAKDITEDGYKNIYINLNQFEGERTEMILGNTIHNFSRYVNEVKPNLIVIHGDRIEALAGAIVGALTNIHIAHIEGGETSGSIDESIRHSISKLSNSHFVSHHKFAEKLISMGEHFLDIHIIGSPDYDIMLSSSLPDIKSVKEKLKIEFEKYAILSFHSVTTEEAFFETYSKEIIDGVFNSNKDFIVIAPNNDQGVKKIQSELSRIIDKTHFKVFDSIPFEQYLVLLKHAVCIVGNSSVGVRQAPGYGIPSINIGTRQNNRSEWEGIKNVGYSATVISKAIVETFEETVKYEPSYEFGKGNSDKLFLQILETPEFWHTKLQK